MSGRTRYRILFAGTAAVIIYGSLYPFQLVWVQYPGGPVTALLSTWHEGTGLGDILANVCLYVPFAFLAVLSLPGSRARRFSFACVLGLLLSGSMELLQLFDEGRWATMADVRSNFAGSVLGAALAVIAEQYWRRHIKWSSRRRIDKSAAIPLTCWVAYRLFPYIPVIDLHKYWLAIRPLLKPDFDWLAVCRHTASWLAVAALLAEFCPPAWRRFAPLACFLAITCVRILLLAVALSTSEVAGGAIAAGAWVLYLWSNPRAITWIAALFSTDVALEGLAPFHFSAERQPFTWIPFYGLLEAAPHVAVPSFLQKGFAYGALVWLVNRAGMGYWKAVVAGSALVAALTIAHLHLPGRSFEITDCLLLLAFAGTEAMLRRPTPQTTSDASASIAR